MRPGNVSCGASGQVRPQRTHIQRTCSEADPCLHPRPHSVESSIVGTFYRLSNLASRGNTLSTHALFLYDDEGIRSAIEGGMGSLSPEELSTKGLHGRIIIIIRCTKYYSCMSKFLCGDLG